jgi:6-phosphogluconate dehydrogenase (decarboxylating)
MKAILFNALEEAQNRNLQAAVEAQLPSITEGKPNITNHVWLLVPHGDKFALIVNGAEQYLTEDDVVVELDHETDG